jgi:pyruvate/2-oxoacid:ferredoxin oxidoreductase alpha subunit
MARRMITVDANEAVASVAHRTNEVIVIYPLTVAVSPLRLIMRFFEACAL